MGGAFQLFNDDAVDWLGGVTTSSVPLLILDPGVPGRSPRRARRGAPAIPAFPEERLQGNLAPDLKGAGSRWSEAQLRLRIVDARALNPLTIMPPYYRIEGLDRVAAAFWGKPVLTAEQIEDVVAFLATLRE